MKRTGRKFHWNYTALAFAIPCMGMLFVMLISQYEPFGKYSMLYSDMYHQYYPFFVAFRRALRSGSGLLYTWSIGMGMDYLGLISYYLASPLNLLSVLVPEGWLLEFFSLLVPVKLGFAGMFFAIFLKKLFGKNDASIAVFGGFYGLCAWALGYQWNVMWLDTFALLPLVKNAGSVFLGGSAPEALGDYFAGPNHTLPTSGTARFSSPLGVDDFVKKSSFLYYTCEALGEVAPRIADFAEREGLHAHAVSATIRRRGRSE